MAKMQPQFDTLDCKILQTLSQNARKPFLEIARECNVSGAAVHQRIQKLIASGIIKGFETVLDPATVGYYTCAYVGFILTDPTMHDQLVDDLAKIPEVVECHCTTGKYDLFVKLYARNNDHLYTLINRQLNSIVPCRTETLISFKEEFRHQVPIEECEA